MEISRQIYTYKELMDGLDLGRDDYGIAAMCSKPLRDAFSNNPYLSDFDFPFLYLGRCDGVAAGIAMWFPTKVKIGDTIVQSTGGSTLEVYKDYRKYEIGADIMMYPIMTEGFNFLLYAGISEEALKIYKKIKFTVFEYPRAMRVCNSRSILESKGISGGFLNLSTCLCNSALKLGYTIANIFSSRYGKYVIKKLDEVPSWVNDMVLNDGHKYMEVHDQKWLQWNLTYNLHGDKDDIQSFYGIYKNNQPEAFFMTKERYRELAGGTLKNIIIGSIMEWAISPSSELEEGDIYRMAVPTFNKKVDIIEYATDDQKVVRKMKKYGFIPHGFAHIVLKDLAKKYKDIGDMSQWRIRFGYSDVFLT